MKNRRTDFLYLIAILFILTSCGKTKDFEFRRIEGLDLHHVSFTKSSLGGRLIFNNPNNFGVTLKHLQSDVTVDGSKLGTCTADSTIRIKGNEEFSVPVVIHFTSIAAIMGAMNILTKDSVLVRFTGTMKVGRVGVFINYKFDNLNKISTKF